LAENHRGFISSVVGIDDVEIEWAKLSTPNGHLVELLEYKSHPVTNQSGKPYTANRHGCSHLAFTVDGSLDDIYKELISSGYSTISPPNENEIGVKVLYCHDPDGVIVEMVEEPDQ
jgi:catechol 2,3-dioxygenase-like lactoylglutathione lyase family enzyme